MLRIDRHFVWSVFLILIVITNLMNVNVAFADDGTPPPTATEEPTQPPVESTETPVVETPAPTETPVSTEETLVTEEQVPASEEAVPSDLLSEFPENTDLVVLDENGNPVSLASQEAVSILEEADPIWCPASQAIPTPGANGCTTNQTITSLLALMQTNAGGVFSQDGIIYLEKPVGQGFTTPLILDNSAASLSGSFATLSAFNLIIRGGWNGNNPGTFSANTNFGVSGGNEGYVLIGSAANPWAGNITLQDIKVTNVSVANSVTVYTSSGNIVLSNVDVTGQKGTNYTAYLDSNSGNIIVQNASSFDGDNTGGSRNKGFYAETNSGSISITGGGPDPTFKDARGTDPANYNGATLSAPTVTLTNVISQDNDGNGIEILNANVVTLNNVTSGVNASGQGNGLSGVLVNGTGTTVVTISGGSFSNNGRYGIEILSSGAITIVSNPFYNANALGNFSENTPPNTSITSNPPSSTSNTSASFSFTGTDNTTPGVLTFQCSPDGAAFTACTSPINYAGLVQGNHNFKVRAVDESGNTDPTPASFSWAIDLTGPVISPHGDETVEATSSAGAVVNYTNPATSDAVDGAGVASCSPVSGSLFALGDTTVTCTASDTAGNVATPSSFVVHVVDTTAPTLNLPTDITANATGSVGVVVSYSASASDIVDGSVLTNCSPASGSTFPLGSTTVNCSAVDSHGNSANGSFIINVIDLGGPALNLPANSVTEATIPVTGDELIDLDCFTVANAFGIMVTFHNLCDQQAGIGEITNTSLPGALPSGYSFVAGLDIQVLDLGQILEALPNNAGVQMEFPLGGSQDQFAVLYWNDGQWVEITQPMNDNDLDQVLSTNAQNELYKMSSSNSELQKVLTTEFTGTFVLVKK